MLIHSEKNIQYIKLRRLYLWKSSLNILCLKNLSKNKYIFILKRLEIKYKIYNTNNLKVKHLCHFTGKQSSILKKFKLSRHSLLLLLKHNYVCGWYL